MLTIGQLKKIIEENQLGDDVLVCLPYESNKSSSMDIRANLIHVLKSEYSSSGEDRITLSWCDQYPSGTHTIKVLVGRGMWNEETAVLDEPELFDLGDNVRKE